MLRSQRMSKVSTAEGTFTTLLYLPLISGFHLYIVVINRNPKYFNVKLAAMKYESNS